MVSFVCLDSTEQWSGSAPDQCVQTIPYFKTKFSNFVPCLRTKLSKAETHLVLTSNEGHILIIDFLDVFCLR